MVSRTILATCGAMAGLLLVPLNGTPALAQAPARADVPEEEPVLLEAEEMDYDEDSQIVTASGNVEITQGLRVLYADRVTYNRSTAVVTADGSVRLLEPTGEVVFADHVELTDDLRDGVIERLAARLTDDSRFAAANAVRQNGNRTVMDRAVFSPCEVCEENPTAPPLWQMKAREVVHDQEAQDIIYRDARLEMFGVPVAYTPYFSHPDPTVERRTGFLAPTFGSDSKLGYLAQVPYYWSIAENEDLTFAPIFMTGAKPVMAGEYRRLFTFGRLDVDASFGLLDRDDEERGNQTDRFRGHVHALGDFALDPNWRAGFEIYRASDDTYLDTFDFDSSDTLRSTAEVEGFFGRSYTTANAFSVQDLREDVDGSRTPDVLPNVEYHYVSERSPAGDLWSFDASFLALHRASGPEHQRVSSGGGWERRLTTSGGHRLDFGAKIRADAYWAENQEDEHAEDGFTGRIYPRLEAGWRYPLAAPTGAGQLLLEPQVTAVAAPNGLNDDIPNEDSRAFEFDTSNLFSGNRFTGLDRVDDGQRISYGVKFGHYGSDGGVASLLIGQSLQHGESDTFGIGSGIDNGFSDYVGRARIAPNELIDVRYGFRLDQDDLSLRRSELGFRVGGPRLNLSGEWIMVDNQLEGFDEFEDRDQIDTQLSSRFSEHWSGYIRHQRDLEDGMSLLNSIGFQYMDECFTFDTRWTREYTRSREESGPSDTILFRLVFKHLGEIQTQQSLNLTDGDDDDDRLMNNGTQPTL